MDSTGHCCWRAGSIASDIARLPAICEIVVVNIEWELDEVSVKSVVS
jgi:hypothetical protein